MRKALLLPGFAALAGLAGFVLRRWQLATAFEPDTGLPIAGAPASWVLLALTLLVCGGLLLLAAGLRDSCEGMGYGAAFAAPGSAPYAMAAVAAAGLLGVSGVLRLLALPAQLAASAAALEASAAAGYQQDGALFRSLMSAIPQMLLAVLCLLGAWCVARAARYNYRAEGNGSRAVWLLGPPFCACLWLVAAYQEHAADPVISDYVYRLFAIVAAVLALYSMAGFSFEKPKPVRTAFFSLLAVYLSGASLADGPALSELLLYAFAAVYLLASAAILLKNIANSNAPQGGVIQDEP